MNLLDVIQKDFFEKITPLLKSGYVIDPSDLLIKKLASTVGWDGPWIFHIYDQENKETSCIKWHSIQFQHFGHIPLECFDCYKVVVRPKTVVDLIKLKDAQAELPKDISCKCGIELRHYTNALYGGYFYCRGIEQGLDRLDFVRSLVEEKGIDCHEVFLKRGCTEYEIKYGRSDQWEHDPIEREASAWIDKKFDKSCFKNPLHGPDEEQTILHSWINFAFDKGDNSYLELTGGEPLYDPPIRYERTK